MRRRLSRFLLLCLWTVSAAVSAQVSSQLVAEKQVRQADGQVHTEPAKEVRPGDVVVYTATYRNTSTKPARAFVATVPVPAGMEWQGAAGEKPAPQEASLDGQSYSPIPLRRKVKAPSGQELLREVPLSEYRFLRWRLPDLAAGAAVSVKVVAKVSTNP